MIEIKPANSYHGVVEGCDTLTSGRTSFKIYYVSVVGRDDPRRTEWGKCGIDRKGFVTSLAQTTGVEGVGFITAFPHITKVFRFGPESEVVMNVRAWNTRDLAPIDLTRSDGYVEFACLAEAAIAAHEFDFWAEAPTVEDYLGRWSTWAEGPILRHDKLRKWWYGDVE